MRFSLPSLLLLSCFSSSIIALPVEYAAQDTVAVIAAARNIGASFNNLLDAIRDMEKFRSSNQLSEKTEWVLHHAKDLTGQLNHGIADVGRGPTVTNNDISTMWGWNGPYDQLLTSVKNTVNAWIASKNTIVSTGGKRAVSDVLQEHRKLSKQFTDTLSAKLPSSGQSYGSNLARQWVYEFDRALTQFK
jgi:hypothetical protein